MEQIMPNNPFDTNPELQKISDNLTTIQNPESLLEVFKKVSALQPDARAYVIDKFEAHLDETLQEILNAPISVTERVKANAAYLEQLGVGAEIYREQLNDMFCTSQAVAFIIGNKGDTALESIKTYAAEAAKLSDAEYAIPCNHAKIWAGIVGKNKAPTQNPFRKNK